MRDAFRNWKLLLARAGSRFWQGESYDRLVRPDAEFGRIRRYIENNPVWSIAVGATFPSRTWSSFLPASKFFSARREVLCSGYD